MQLIGGANPFLVLAQQGSQVIPVFGGVAGTINAIKAAAAAALTPTNLLRGGIAALAAAAAAYIADQSSAESKLVVALEKQESLVKRIRDAWGGAANSAAAYYKENRAVLDDELKRNLDAIRSRLQETAQSAMVGNGVRQSRLLPAAAAR